jgi:DNA-binding response OmpR family regulator
MEKHLDRLAEEIAAVDVSQESDHRVQEMLAASGRGKSASERKIVFLCEDDPFQRQSIATQIGCFGFEVISFDRLETFRDAVRNSPPDSIVMGMIFPQRQEGEMIGELKAAGGHLPPTVFISSHNDLSSRLSAVRAGSSAYFAKPLSI